MAKAGDADLDSAVATAVGWEKLAARVAEAEHLARPARAEPRRYCSRRASDAA